MRLAHCRSSSRTCLAAILLSLAVLLSSSCNKPSGPIPPVDRLSSCLPKTEGDGKVRLSIVAFENGKDEARVRVVFYSGADSAGFALPVYYTSRGKWLIDEKDRAYLVDPQCRQFSLHDRHDAKWTDAPPDGKVTLKPGAAFETVLDFPPLPPNTTHGALVYGPHVVPFSLLPSDGPK